MLRLHRASRRDHILISAHGRFMLSLDEATQAFDATVYTVRKEWQPALRRAGVSATECERLRRAFVHEGLFYQE